MEEKILFEILAELKEINKQLEEVKEIQKKSCNFLLEQLQQNELTTKIYR
ncbi:MAG: hypothetical protein IJX80_05100 [Clostridia bacterium]|nr:hypothetical protein [Clostridia bacterium]